MPNVFHIYLTIVVLVKSSLTHYAALSDDVINIPIHKEPLPQQYQITQDEQTPLHPFIIKPAWDLSEARKHQRYIHQMTRIFHIAAFYFEKVIKVQNIPGKRTILKKKPENLRLPNGQITTIQISPHFQKEGFGQQQVDLLIFMKMTNQFYDNQTRIKSSNQFISGTLQMQRRPLYGFMIVQLQTNNDISQLSKVYIFHHRVERTIHAIMHILGLSTQFLLSDPYQSIASIISQTEDAQTLYFKSPYSQRPKMFSEMIFSINQTIFLKSEHIRQAAYELFSCYNKILLQDMGIPLDSFQKTVQQNGQSTLRKVLVFHFSSEYGLNQQVMQVHNYKNIYHDIYTSNAKISQLSLSFLKDTGFYEDVTVSQQTTDYYTKKKDIKNRQDIIFFNQIYDSCTFEQKVLQVEQKYCPADYYRTRCDIYGQISLIANYTLRLDSVEHLAKDQNKYIDCIQLPVICQAHDLSRPKCFQHLQLVEQNLNTIYVDQKPKKYALQNQNCYFAQCFIQDGDYVIRVVKGALNFTGCRKQQKEFKIYERLILKCPQNKQSFCKAKFCQNMCSRKGLCVRGSCVTPKKTMNWQEILQLSSHANSSIYCFQSKLPRRNNKCQVGCLVCKCTQLECILADPRYSTAVLDFNNTYNSSAPIPLQFPITCIYNCKYCQINATLKMQLQQNLAYLAYNITCHVCHQEFFLAETKSLSICSRCISSTCTSCLEEGHFGVECTNCLQGFFINDQRQCQPCTGLDNCQACRRRTNQKLECIKCVSGYQLISEFPLKFNSSRVENACTRCLPACSICDQLDIRVCHQCFQGFFMVQSKQKAQRSCQKCSQNCKICKSHYMCIQCLDLYILRRQEQGLTSCIQPCDKKCFQCQKDNVKKCKQCFQQYQIDNFSSTCIENLSCNSYSCTSCPDYYGLNISLQLIYGQPTIKATCQLCKVQFCISCIQQLVRCFKCEDGYFVTQKDQDCIKCPIQCKTCKTSQICTDCSYGYTKTNNMDGTIFQNKCIKCTHNCQTCSGSPHLCLSCVQNYSLIGKLCISSKNSVNCTLALIANQSAQSDFIENKLHRKFTENLLQSFKLYNNTELIFLSISKSPLTIKFNLGAGSEQANLMIKNQLSTIGDIFWLPQIVSKTDDLQKHYNDLGQNSSNIAMLQNPIIFDCYIGIYLIYKMKTLIGMPILIGQHEFIVNGSKYDYSQSSEHCYSFQIRQNAIIKTVIIAVSSVLFSLLVTIIIVCCFIQRQSSQQSKIRQQTNDQSLQQPENQTMQFKKYW